MSEARLARVSGMWILRYKGEVDGPHGDLPAAQAALRRLEPRGIFGWLHRHTEGGFTMRVRLPGEAF